MEMGHITLLMGSLGALIAAIAGLIEAASRLRSRGTERRQAEAEAEDIETGTQQKLQAIWGEEFARRDKRIEELEHDMEQSRETWTRERVGLKVEVDELRAAVEALRGQVRQLDPSAAPVA